MTPTVSQKILRTFVWTFLGFFLPVLAAICIKLATGYETGEAADWNVIKALVLGGMFGGFAASIRAIIAFLPLLPDDNVGIQKKP